MVASYIVHPLAVCMLPVMIGALIAVLEGYPVLPFLTVGFPLAMILAMTWTVFQVFGTIAEVHVRPGAAAVRTVSEVLRSPSPSLMWKPIYELRKASSMIVVALGDATYELPRRQWPETDTLLDALRAARQQAQSSYASS